MIDEIIQPEILNDEFHATLKKYASRHDLKTFLEIGSSSGGGSTDAFVSGIKQRADVADVRLFCMEVSRVRFKALAHHYATEDFVRCYNISSVAASELPSQEEVINFYTSTKTTLNNYPLETVLGWLKQDIEYILNSGSDVNGIALIKKANHIQNFDMVLIDGSEFTGERELHSTTGAKIIALDDVNAFKCWNAYQTLLNTTHYALKEHNFSLRNGYAIFEKKF
jgi:hypothetical protein